MKKIRIISLLTVLALLFALGCGSLAAYATSGSDGAPAVSGGDLVGSGSDVPVMHISDYKLESFKVNEHRFSIKFPALDNVFSANSTDAEIGAMLSGYGLEELMNYSYDYYGGSLSYLYSGYSSDQSVSINALYFSNKYTQFIGDYNKLSEEKLSALAAGTSLLYNGGSCDIVTINGRKCLWQEYADTEAGSYSYGIETVVNGGKYQVFIDMAYADTLDHATAQKILKSARFGGLKPANLGAADSGLVIALLVIVCILFVIVCLLAFFIGRFSLYSSAAGGKFNIIGFDLPQGVSLFPSKRRDDDEYDEYDEYDDDLEDEDE